MPLPTMLVHCVMHVSDWERPNAFYRDVLGAKLAPRPTVLPIASASNERDR